MGKSNILILAAAEHQPGIRKTSLYASARVQDGIYAVLPSVGMGRKRFSFCKASTTTQFCVGYIACQGSIWELWEEKRSQ